ncbi:hypothetical protein [Sporofaciens sp. SGI.106]|uniref:hypothetical protein n=1 Tax=Sporofaciens sp. SGI.106 TaxID=3420568 RepID=UPI003D018BFA
MSTTNNYSETDLGNVSPNPCGEYSDEKEYEYLDLISLNGGSYLCIIELGKTVSNVPPNEGKNSDTWQCVALPGDLTPEYVSMHDHVVNLAEQVEADAEEVRKANVNVSNIKINVEQMQEQTRQSAESAEQSKENAAGYAESAELSRQAAKIAEQNVNAQVSGFDNHVLQKTTESEEDIEAVRIAANKAILAQQKESIQHVKDQTSQYISDQEAQAKTNIENYTGEQINNVNQAVNVVKGQLQGVINEALTEKSDLSVVVNDANTAKEKLQGVVDNADNLKNELNDSISSGVTTKQNLDESTNKANTAKQSLNAENASATSNLEELRNENFNSQEILAGVADLRAYLGLSDEDILGVQVDYKNKTFTRLAGAVNLTNGSDFDRFSMFGGRRRCNVADDGTIVAWYGDADYAEDGSMGQVMVYQPKFYYLVCPVVYDPIDTGVGYHLRKANYYVSEKPRAGFRLHPAFYDANGNEIDYFLTSAYEGSIFDVSADAFLMNDEQVMTVSEDKFCSIAGVKPASGLTQNLTRPNIEQMAKNRGDGWHGDLIKQVSAEQMLMIIEMGMMNLQTAIAQGIVSISDNSAYNCSSLTGSTASIGNGTGRATETINEKGGATTTETADGKTAVCWRGKENFWGNIWKFVYGINIWGNGSMGGGQPYICNDFNFAESRNSENYEAAGFTVTNANGYVSAMGYSTTCDWLFIASECLGNSSLPVGDYTYITVNLNGYRITLLGGCWNDGGNAGAFYWDLSNGVGLRYRYFGGRLVYIPTKDSAVYNAAIASWKEQMAA